MMGSEHARKIIQIANEKALAAARIMRQYPDDGVTVFHFCNIVLFPQNGFSQNMK